MSTYTDSRWVWLRRLRVPTVTWYRVADPRPFSIGWTRSMTLVIGANVVVGAHCLNINVARAYRKER